MKQCSTGYRVGGPLKNGVHTCRECGQTVQEHQAHANDELARLNERPTCRLCGDVLSPDEPHDCIAEGERLSNYCPECGAFNICPPGGCVNVTRAERATRDKYQTYYRELLAVIYGEIPDGINERPDPRTFLQNERATAQRYIMDRSAEAGEYLAQRNAAWVELRRLREALQEIAKRAPRDSAGIPEPYRNPSWCCICREEEGHSDECPVGIAEAALSPIKCPECNGSGDWDGSSERCERCGGTLEV